MAQRFATVDDYINSYPADVRAVLGEIRRTIRNVVPEAGEKISYQMPTITLDGRYLVYFAAWKHHVSIYPLPSGDEAFEREIAPYRAAKATVRFPLDEPIPYDLVERIVKLLLAHRTR